MQIRRLPGEEAAVRRYLEELWIPYNRELETIVDGFALADDVDLVAEELEYRLARHDAETYHAWVAVDGGDDSDSPATTDGKLAGFVTTEVDESSTVFDRPDRLTVCDIYVREQYRGTGLAQELIARARRRARQRGCDDLRLEVDVENERAISFYDSLGFEPTRYTMVADVDDH